MGAKILRNPGLMTPSERRKFADEERKRLSELDRRQQWKFKTIYTNDLFIYEIQLIPPNFMYLKKSPTKLIYRINWRINKHRKINFEEKQNKESMSYLFVCMNEINSELESIVDSLFINPFPR